MDTRALEPIGDILANRVDDARISYILDNTTTPDVNYHGFYAPIENYADYVAGVDTGASIFMIAKESVTAGITMSMLWASGSFDAEWDNRATLDYY